MWRVGLTGPTFSKHGNGDHDGLRDNENALIDSDHWRFTPSAMDANSFNFSSFVNQTPGELTPSHGAFSNLFHSQAEDLHTPATAFRTDTPLSTDTNHPIPAMDLNAFHPHLLQSQGFHNPSDYHPPPQSYAPSTFLHRDSGYDTTDHSVNEFAEPRQEDENPPTDFANIQPTSYLEASSNSVSSLEKYAALDLTFLQYTDSRPRFRFHVTLNAPTAMVKSADEIPITYLNKGQAYAISINDSLGLGPTAGLVKYRTVVRISFEDEQQRQRPSQSWQLWKEGRGLAEAHQRGGKLHAVEYVDPNQGGEIESRKPRIELENASFDCFSVTWSPSPGASVASCAVSVRFNFLSTDFSHSKGVKGIPVRLCAKTEVISSGTPDSPPGPTAEICFCKVKLFRDHGAERKLSNDIAHIKKTIEKLKQQIAQIESGVKEGKRKRSGSMAASNRPTKMPKHKRTWSVSSQGSTGKGAIEDDLHSKLAMMQDMFSSTRPVSVLYLRGYDDDDPDTYPVSLPGDPSDLLKIRPLDRKTSWDGKQSEESTPTNPAISCTPSSQSMPAESPSKINLHAQIPNSIHRSPPQAHISCRPTCLETSDLSHTDVKVSRMNQNSTQPQWIHASGVDPSYQAPPEPSVKPAACFYVLIRIRGDTPDDDCYRAVYLMERTVKDLIASIAIKCGIQPDLIHRTIRINPKGLKIVVDNDVVQGMSEGQDMTVEFNDLDAVKSEPLSGNSTPKASSTRPQKVQSNLEMRLIF